MTLFITDEKHPSLRIRVTRLGRTIQFEQGRYETDDPDEIRALRHNRHVTDFSEVERELRAPAAIGTAFSGAAPDLSRDELDQVARQAGVEDPEKLPNKDAVTEAIDAARASTDS